MEPEPLTVHLFVVCLAAYAAGAIASFALTRFPRMASLTGFSGALIGGLAGCLTSLMGLSQGTSPGFTLLPAVMPFARLSVQLDPLAAFFALVISLLGLTISVYSYGYVTPYYGVKNVGSLAGFFNFLLLATTLVFCADNVVLLLIAWELMALFAFVLVVFEHEHPETRRAGVLYFVMSPIGVGCLILGFLLLFQATGSFRFEDLHNLGARLSLSQRTAAFFLFFVGFGIKAGIIPLHIWLPAAHPVAPSNISAFMSGVLIKTGIYGMVRVFFDFLTPPPVFWGLLILAVGSISALLGVLYALVEHDLKRWLAFHSIENIGIILMGLGASLLFISFHQPALAALALVAGLYRTLNHACFKRLLFLGAGAVRHATGTRNMEELGGLIRRLPWTAFLFLRGAVAISGLPPLNGFVSEWLTYQALLQGFGATEFAVRLIFPVGWRGEILHRLLTSANGSLVRCKIKDPSLNNWPALPEAVQGNIIPDFPVMNKSFNLSYSGTDR